MSEALNKTERKHMAHFLDAAFDMTFENTEYALLGLDLTEFNVELNPEIETEQNIIGDNSIKHNGYAPTANVTPFYHKYGDTLSEKILDLAMARGRNGWTSYVEALCKPGETEATAPTVTKAYRENVLIAPTSYGGDVGGVQAEFTIYFAGNRVSGTWDRENRKFTPDTTA